MTATNSGLNWLSLLCLGIVFVGGWYFQSSLVEMREQLVAQQQEQKTHMIEAIAQQRIKIEVQAEIIQQLKETVKEQNKQLNLLQLKINQHQPTVSWLIPVTMYISNSICICYRVMTSSPMNLSILTIPQNNIL